MTDQVRKILDCYRSENPGVLTNLARILNHGRLGGTGRMIILPVDQGFEHGPARSFAPNPPAYDPAYHFQLAIDAGLNAYASLLGFLEASAADFAGEIPLIFKLNAHDLLHEEKDPLGALTASISDALRLGCVAIGYTIYPGTAERRLQYEQLRELASEARAAGLVVVVWSYPRGGGLSKEGETALDVIAYGAQIAALLGAHIIKVKMPTAHLELPDARKVYEDHKIPRDTAGDRVRHVVQSASTDGALSSSPVDQRKAMKPFSPKRARSATAADSAQLSGGIRSSETKRPLCASLMRWSVSTRNKSRETLEEDIAMNRIHDSKI